MSGHELGGAGRPAAFFDLDRTLISVNSAKRYIQNERKQGRVTTRQMFLSAFYLMLYHFSLADIKEAYRRAAMSFRGKDHAELTASTLTWFLEEIAETIQPGGESALQEHKAQGHPCVLLTGSTSYLAKIVTDHWELDDWLATQFVVDDDGKMTGEIDGPICYSDGKVVLATEWAKQNGVDLKQSYFYTDSFSDLPMLEVVGFPRIVNPDPRLRRMANRRGWPILDWQEVESQEATS
ncbi:MAG: HAD-IB family hydrolase [Deltaproteobacteria bacterium]|nr:HAD-IB family hydrolase [Deltaproteobacteria bacterium]|tara:strand:+ start:275 stop:985 length:711 start_codon:yes stop_codon:yes gene_type:complete